MFKVLVMYQDVSWSSVAFRVRDILNPYGIDVGVLSFLTEFPLGHDMQVGIGVPGEARDMGDLNAQDGFDYCPVWYRPGADPRICDAVKLLARGLVALEMVKRKSL